MQPDDDVVVHTHPSEEDDEDSLFGSPPPSPIRGRSPSPTLALPSSGSGAGEDANTQNVGIIALPGSQHCSELPINPLALSLSYGSQPSLAGNQPASSHSSNDAATGVLSASSTPSLSRASSRTPSAPPIRKKKAKSRTASPRPPPPEIPLPSPSEPIPPNWLRSQSALLGHAGLVGGVNTVTLSTRHTQGASSLNPIVIDDDTVGDSIRWKPQLPKLVKKPEYPAPSTREIVQILIKQKEVFPILQDILKLLAKDTSQRPAPSSQLTQPPKKKRRMDTVPAGAEDWDIPFPFPQGEGPGQYRSNWERDRQRQLVSQLVCLIKAASRKAAFRDRLRQQLKGKEPERMHPKELEHLQPKVGGHYGPEAAMYGGNGSQQASAESSNRGSTPILKTLQVNSHATPNLTAASESIPFDQLISSLLDNSGVSFGSGDDIDADFSSPVTSSSDHTSELDDGFIDVWNTVFQSFPIDGHSHFFSAGTSGAFPDPVLDPESQPVISASSSSLSTPTTSSAPLHENSLLSHPVPDSPVIQSSSNSHSAASISDQRVSFPLQTNPSTVDALDLLYFHQGAQVQTQQQKVSVSTLSMSSTLPDSLIDPELLALSVPANLPGRLPPGTGVQSPPPFCGSPMPSMSSMSSYGDFDVPRTPTSAMGDLVSPIIANPGGELDIGRGMGIGSTTSDVIRRGDRMVEESQVQGETAVDKGKGKVQDIETDTALHSVLPVLLSEVLNHTQNEQQSKAGPNASRSGSSMPKNTKSSKNKKLDKKELLKRARERRTLLAEEIVKTRMQLWETTIEHGALMNIAKYHNSS